MDFTPGEKAVLAQIRALYKAAGRDQLLKALLVQWPPTHHAAYRSAYAGLVAKRLIEQTGTQGFRITDAGLTAIGAPPPAPQPKIPSAAAPKSPRPHQEPGTPVKRRDSLLGRLANGFLRRTGG